MDNNKIKKWIFGLECVIFLLVAVMLGLSMRQSIILNNQIRNLESDVQELQEKLDEASSKKTEGQETELAEGQEKEPENTPAPTETPVPTETPTPTPTPSPAYLMDLTGYAPGEIIEDSLIDQVNLGQYFSSSMIVEGDPVFERIIDRSFRYNDNIALSDLRYIKLIHRNFSGETQVGEIIVNAAIEADVIDIFMQFYMYGYQINSMYLIDNFWRGDGDSSDFASIDVDNTSAFCYRTVTGSSTNLSNHAYGLAIDLNPLENPYVRYDGDGYGVCAHDNAQAYVNNRSSASMPHVIDHEDLAYQLFADHGFTWGGDWNNPKDYQHFQKELY